MSELILNTNDGGGAERVLPKTGLNQAVLVSMVDIGTQEQSDYNGEKRDPARKLIVTFALTNQHHIFDEEKGPQPLYTSKWLRLSLHEKAGLRKMVKAILGKDIDGEFNLFSMLGKNCMLNLVESKDGKYVNIDSFAPLMDGFDAVTDYDTTAFSLSSFDWADFNELLTWQKERIRLSPEFKNIEAKEEDAPAIETETPFD